MEILSVTNANYYIPMIVKIKWNSGKYGYVGVTKKDISFYKIECSGNCYYYVETETPIKEEIKKSLIKFLISETPKYINPILKKLRLKYKEARKSNSDFVKENGYYLKRLSDSVDSILKSGYGFKASMNTIEALKENWRDKI